MEIFLLTSVIVTLFLVFVITVIRETSKVNEPGYKPTKVKPKGGRYSLYNLLEELLDDTPKPKKKSKSKPKRRTPKDYGTVADMESDGVYFDKKK